jgi:tetratricopeptide (TPR) repeat protein
VILALLCLLAPPAPATLDAGFDALYHLEFSRARQIFEQWRKQHPAHPLGPAAIAASHLFEEFEHHGVLTTAFFLNDETLLGGIKGTPRTTPVGEFHRAVQQTRTLARTHLDADPAHADSLLAMTLVAGMEANAASLIEKRQLEALIRIREAESHARKLLALAPGNGDAYMALGAASYIVGSLPAYKRVFARIGGVKGDRARGIEQLRIASARGRYLKAYAKMMLALALLREQQAPEARALLDELILQYPQSPLFRRERGNF